MSISNPLKLSVGIPAYNEVGNILRLLKSIFDQAEDGFKLFEVILISDGSTDATVKEASKISNSKIKILEKKDRKGKTERCNELFDVFQGDTILQLDADMVLSSPSVFSELVKVFQEGQYGFVAGNLTPLPPKTYAESLAYFGVATWMDILNRLGPEKSLLHRCVGGARIFSRSAIQKFRFPKEIGSGEDVYTFFSLLNAGEKIGFAEKAIVHYRLAATFPDYIKQMHRFLHTRKAMPTIFGNDTYLKEDHITIGLKLKAFARRVLTTNPTISLGYALLQIFTRATQARYKRSKLWDIASSTKHS